jgi:tripartite-type tricarboxylate transporter receptor subunit TctC
MSSMVLSLGRIVALACWLLVPAALWAQSALADYPDRNIDLIIPFGPGGGFDLYARAVARVMESHLPKGVKVIPRNIAGAGGAKGIATMLRAAPDGYTMGILGLPGSVEPQIVGDPVGYDLDNVTWLGVVNIGVYSLVVGPNGPFQTLESFHRATGRPPYFATTGSTDLELLKIVAATLGLNVKYLTGYNGGPETHLAIMRGEADAGLGMDVMIAPHLAAGELKQLVWFQKRGARGTPGDAPTADDIGHPELANLSLFRLFAAPAGLPAAVRQRLVDAVQAALNDPLLAKWAQDTNFPIDPGTAEAAGTTYVAQKAFLIRNRNFLKPD